MATISDWRAWSKTDHCVCIGDRFGGHGIAVEFRKSIDHVGNTHYFCWLCHHLHLIAQASNTTKYCDWWIVWGDATCAGLGSGGE